MTDVKDQASSKIDLTFCVVGNMLGRNTGFVTTQGQILSDLLTNEGYQVICTSSRLNRLGRLKDILNTIIRNRKQIDILILEVYSGLYFVVAEVASLLAGFFGISMIFVLHGGNLTVFAARFKRWVKWVLGRADLLVAPSPFLANGLGGFGLPIRIVPNIVEMDNYPFRIRSNVQPKLLWMRAFHELYNPGMAVQVFCLVKQKYPFASLVMAGVDKGLEPEMKKMVEGMGLRDAVRFPGFLGQDEKIKEFSVADIFINTNHVDNMPVAVIEACAMGLPVVATCVGGIPDMITDRQNGLLVPDGDAKGMAEAIISLLENTELAEDISKNGRMLAARSSWEVVRADWEELFEEIMQVKDRTANLAVARQASNP